MDKKFIKQCDKEIEENKKKGDWKSFKPSRKKITQELNWHIAKLNSVVLDEGFERHSYDRDTQIELIQEYSSDVANICEKIFTLAETERHKNRVRRGCYGQHMGYTEVGWPYAYEGE